MRLSSTIGATLTLCTSALAWEIVVYSDSACGQNNGDYLILDGSGSSASTCFFLGGTRPSGVSCQKFTDGGANGPLDCAENEFADAYSFDIDSGSFYLADARSANSGNCETGFGSSQKGCQSIHVRGFSASG